MLHELIVVDNMQTFFPNFSQALPKDNLTATAFSDLVSTVKQDAIANPELAHLANAFETTIKSASDLANGLKEQNQQQVSTLFKPAEKSSALDFDYFLEYELHESNVSRKRLAEVVKIIASDFKKVGMAHMMNMKSSDLYRQAWAKDGVKEQTHLLKFIRYTNKISETVINDIVNAKTIQHQERVTIFYCQVLEELIRIGDYNTATLINGALNNSSILRQKHLFENKEISRIFENSKKIFNTEKNYANYRSMLEKHKNEAIVPYMGVYATDLTMLDERMQYRLSNGDINVDKLNSLNEIYKQVEQFTKQIKKESTTGQQSTITDRVNRNKFDADIAFKRSSAFRARAISMSENMLMGELLAKFPEQTVPTYLEIKIQKDEKESVLLNKNAYKFIIKQIINNAHQANEIDKAAAYKLVNNIAKVAKINNLDTKIVNKLIEAARLVTEVDVAAQNMIDFIKNAVDIYHKTTTLQAELKEQGNMDAAKPLAFKAEEIKNKLAKATTNPDKQISEQAKKSLASVDLIASITTLSEKYQSLKTEFMTMHHSPDSLKRKIIIQDQMDNIEEQLRKAAKHSDQRIKKLAEDALATHKIGAQKLSRFAIKAPPKEQADKRKAMLLSPHRPQSLNEAIAKPDISMPVATHEV
ncbi:MAG TPA: RasGEF domain-containing protein, partial [Candidatus Berkiella sp.]|nr:RasGEF domain-containing protein [Candidatus Berkiella sp.]